MTAFTFQRNVCQIIVNLVGLLSADLHEIAKHNGLLDERVTVHLLTEMLATNFGEHIVEVIFVPLVDKAIVEDARGLVTKETEHAKFVTNH